MPTESKKLKFAREHARILTSVPITETGPGTILRDFDVLLSFVREAPLPLTEATQQPVRSLLSKINARLVHPLQLGLKNPQLKSYPPIMGLYLLLRASGLTYVGGTAKKPLLYLDEDLHRHWLALNPTERYGSLLETWLLRATPQILGERAAPGLMPDNYLRWVQLRDWIPDEGLRASDSAAVDLESIMRYSLEWHNLGVLELFGFVTVTAAPPQPGQGRQIERIAHTQLGDAVMALLVEKYFSKLNPFRMIEGTGSTQPGAVQAVLEPYWPQWKRMLRLPQWTFRPGIHVFDMRLDPVRARLAMPADATLDALASTILNVLEFDHDHLYEFTYRNRFGATDIVRHPFLEEKPWTSEVKIGGLPLTLGQTMTFIYDFGDWWEISLTLETVDTTLVIAQPTVLEQHGQPPSQYPDFEDEYEFDDDDDAEENGAEG